MDEHEYGGEGDGAWGSDSEGSESDAEERLFDEWDAAGEDGASADDPDLYAVLGVPPHADGATLRAAYRSLAAALHPDRQRDPALRDEATAAFRRVCEAHEILGDAARRAVYDAHGMRGIRAGLTLATTEGVQDAQALREALLRRKALRDERRAALKLQGRYVVELDAEDFVRAPDVRNLAPTCVAMAATQSMDVPVSERDVLLFQGHVREELAMQSDTSGAHFIVSWHRVLDAASHVVGRVIMLGSGLGWELSTSRAVSAHDRVTLTAEGAVDPAALADAAAGVPLADLPESVTHPSLQLSWDRQLFADWASRVDYSFPQGVRGGELTTELRRTWANGASAVGAWTMSLVRNLWTLRLERPLLSKATTAMAKASFGWDVAFMQLVRQAEVFGLETRITHRLGKLSKMGLGVSLKSSTGVGVSLHLSHANQHVAIPMLLSSSLGWREALAALTAPHAALSAAYLLVAKPMALRAKQRRQLESRRQNADKVRAALRRAAQAARVLRAPAARKRRSEERAENGLVIVEAHYGNLRAMDDLRRAEGRSVADEHAGGAGTSAGRDTSSGDNGSSAGSIDALPDSEREALEDFAANEGLPPPFLKVTHATQFLVDKGELRLDAEVRRSGMMGFCDPCPGEPKQLRIRYTIGAGSEQVATFGDAQAVVLPPAGAAPAAPNR